MRDAQPDEWRRQLGLEARNAPAFFASIRDVDAEGSEAPQPHALRRAFEQLELDGVLCQDKSPLIYFRVVASIEPSEEARLYELFWNQGVAAILVLIAPADVHVYSSLVQRRRGAAATAGLVEKLSRVADQLQAFVLSVESGEYFRKHRKSFDPEQRVDRDLMRNLEAARERLNEVHAARLEPGVLDALLCRLVFTCYLFDRGAIGRAYLDALDIHHAEHLRDILGRKPRTEAKAQLYKLFAKLSDDFNGDLFSDDLAAEARQVRVEHIEILDRLMGSTDVRTGQGNLWPYNFGILPIETISAIYESFLKTGQAEKKVAGAFYTPRFLAELVLDVALDGVGSLLDKRFLDPACGSGIFLVGLFNRLAEEWRCENPTATYEQRATGLLRLLQHNLFGIDENRTACRIAAFSLYLAFLDQLSPPDICKLQSKGRMLPLLVRPCDDAGEHGNTIFCADFFETDLATQVDVVIGNPPWGSVTDTGAPVVQWMTDRALPFPDRQLATAFVCKAPEHLESGGRVCFVLPHGILFNHSPTALDLQRRWLRQHRVELVLNLADYQRFLFEEAESPALVVRYSKDVPTGGSDMIDYWVPKTDWSAQQAEMVTVLPQDRSRIALRDVLRNLADENAPLIWKQRFWATPRDRRLLDRLSLMPPLRALVGQPSDEHAKRWVIGEGFQPLGDNDDAERAKTLRLPSKLFVEARSPHLSLFLLARDCTKLPSQDVAVRRGRSEKNDEVFRKPHVLITQGFKHSAFVDFDVSFRHAIRGIHGPDEDRDLLAFLAAYLQSSLARFFLFHTSSNWGVSRAKVHVAELLRLPFPTPSETLEPDHGKQIVARAARVVTAAIETSERLTTREDVVARASRELQGLIDEYFDLDEIDKMLISDTDEILIPSVRPTRSRADVPTLRAPEDLDRSAYVDLLCGTLNEWTTPGQQVRGGTVASAAAGIGLVVLERTCQGAPPLVLDEGTYDLLSVLHRLQRTAAKGRSTLELIRGLKVFHDSSLYLLKPLARRFWSRTAALNDADEIATTVLLGASGERR